MATTYKGLVIELGADTSKLQSAMRQVNSATKTTQKQLTAINRALKFNPGNVTLLTQKTQNLSNKVAQTRDKLQLLKQQLAGLDKTQIGTDEWDKLQREIIETESQLQSYERQLKAAEAAQRGASTTLGQMGYKVQEFGNRYKQLGQNLQNIGSKLTMGLTVPLAGVAVAATATHIKFEDAFAGVRKTVDATDEQLQALYKGAVELSKVQPVSAETLFNIEAMGGQLGITTDFLQEFATIVSGLDIATDLDAETAATQLAQFANITGMAQGEMSNFGSALVALGNTSATTESNIMNMAMRIGAAGSQVGLTQAETLGLAAALSSVGIEAEAGGTAISTIMSNIDKDVATNSENLKTWAATAGMSADEFAAAWKDNAAQALQAVIQGMGQMNDEGGNLSLLLDELGVNSIRQTDAFKRLANSGSLLSDSIATANTAWGENIALQNEVDARNETTSAKLEIMKNRFAAIADTLGTIFANALLTLLDALDPIITGIENFVSWLGQADPAIQTIVVTIGVLLAAIGPVLTIVGTILAALPAIGAGMTMVAEAMTVPLAPIAAIVAAIAGFVALLIYLWNTHEGFRNAVTAVWQAICDFIQTIMGIIQPFLEAAWWAIQNIILPILQNILANVGTVFEGILNVITAIMNAVSSIIQGVWDVISGIFQTVLGFIVGLVTGDFSMMSDGINSIMSGIQSIISGIWDAISGIFSAVLGTITGIVENGFNTAKQIVDNVFNAIQSVVSGAMSAVVDTVRGAVDSILGFFGSIWDGIQNIGNAVGGFFGGLFGISLDQPIPLPLDPTIGGLPPLPGGSIPWLATGGIVNKPTVFGAGEAGAEAVMPLSKLPEIMAEAIQIAQGNGNGGNVIVEKMEVRKESDINAIASELYRLGKRGARAKGTVYA